MLPEHDSFLTKITVCLKHPVTDQTIGSGLIYNHKALGDKLYLLTAAHCLFNDGDQFRDPLTLVKILLYNVAKDGYDPIECAINFDLVSAEIDKDIAVIVLDRKLIEVIMGPLPEVEAVLERHSISHFAVKGFPNATFGRELVAIEPTWVQDLPGGDKFQLHLSQDFSTPESARYQVDGFSGSGLFLIGSDRIYLYGIFTRFLEAGKLIYGQYLSGLNDLLKGSFLPLIRFTFFGSHNLTPGFFLANAKRSVDNLGPRFSEALNLKLPIALKFNDLAKDSGFKYRFSKVIDRFLTNNGYRSKEHKGLEEIEKSFDELKDHVAHWFSVMDWSVTAKIETSNLYALLEQFNESAIDLSDSYYKKREELYQQDNEQKGHHHSPPFSGELARIREMQRTNSDLVSGLGDLEIGLANSPFMILKGEAGSGKSHLFGDIVSVRNANGQPTLLLLGQLFKSEQTIWQNILAQLDLQCTKDQFLWSLNAIGKQTGSRALVLIDAINESAGKALWRDAMTGFLRDLEAYPYIGLALSIRTTYWHAIVPESVQKNALITQVTHEGFSGNEYKALQLFCAHYGISQPNFPILATEYTNPLFLQLICQGIKASGKNKFPSGFQGLSKIFDLYTKALTARLELRRDIYKMRHYVVRSALEAFSAAAFEKNIGRSLTIEEALSFFDHRFSRYPELLNDLIEEGVLIKGIRTSYDEDVEDSEILYFAFERFGDFYMAGQLLDPYGSASEVLSAFSKGQKLGQLAVDLYTANNGIIEAFAVLLPERFKLELVEVYQWLFEEDDDHRGYITDSLNQWMIDSLKWRDGSSINDEKITKWIRESGHFGMSIDDYLYFFIGICAVGQHPFNGDRLHRFLSGYSLADRDAFWLPHVHRFHGADDSEMAFPITRLIDWAWQENISTLASEETVRLAGQTLAWLLCSTTRALRDQATKAMVNLLQDQTKALVAILDAFSAVDDMYITERLYAVVYGCALRSENDNGLRTIAIAVYERVFKNGDPPEHILLRDYARNSIEYAFAKGLVSDIDIKKVRPPYRSTLPARYPTELEVKRYEMDPGDPGYRENYGSAAHSVVLSVLSWDFSRYIIDSALYHLSPLRFTFEAELAEWLKGQPRGSKADLKRLEVLLEMKQTYEERKGGAEGLLRNEQAEAFSASVRRSYQDTETRCRSRMNDAEILFLEEQVLPYWALKIQLKNKKNVAFDGKGIKCWIVERVFGLGYDVEKHGQFDAVRWDDGRTSSARVERIGKKYQWIAFYQIMAILTDHYKIQERWSDERPRSYQGPWEMMLRDIDPSFTTREVRNKYPEDEFGIVDHQNEWWSLDKYDHWHRIPSDWAVTTADLPDPAKNIPRQDQDGAEWVHLHMTYTWKEPRLVGKDRWDDGPKEIWYMFQAYFVPKSKAAVIKKWLRGQNLFGRWLPENHSVTDLFARENYWSPITKDQNKGVSIWKVLKDTNYKVMLATETAIGELSEDKSGAHFRYLMPAECLLQGAELRYARRDGEFINSSGEIVITNRSPNGALMRKDVLMRFLEEQDLEVIWLLSGEKNSFNKNDDDEDFRKSLSGVYELVDHVITGSISVNDW